MPFSDFAGNPETIHRLREMLARNRFPHAVILSGAQGSGKYTLALMIARAMNCLEPPATGADGLPDFCGHCSNCTRIAQAEHLDARFAEAVEARENLRDTDKKETRLFVQTHPDVLVIPPDPPQLMIKVDQVRHVIETIYYRPGEARERVYIFTSSAFMKEAANSLLKVLEEPPDFATIFLLTENAGELLPTIRSRSMTFNLVALSFSDIESRLAKLRPDWNARQSALVARLSEGAIGRALSFDLESYVAARSHALIMLKSALGGARGAGEAREPRQPLVGGRHVFVLVAIGARHDEAGQTAMGELGAQRLDAGRTCGPFGDILERLEGGLEHGGTLLAMPAGGNGPHPFPPTLAGEGTGGGAQHQRHPAVQVRSGFVAVDGQHVIRAPGKTSRKIRSFDLLFSGSAILEGPQ